MQAAACLNCGQAWLFPRDLPDEAKDRFPLKGGLWENPCPDCDGGIWVAEPIPADVFEAAGGTI